MRARVVILVASLVLVGGLVTILLAFPTKYGCNSGGPAFTTSRSVAYNACVSGVTGDPAPDRRLPARGLVLTLVVLAEVILLRFGFLPENEQRGIQKQMENGAS